MVEVMVMVVGVAATENTEMHRWMQGIHALFMQLNVDAGLRILFPAPGAFRAAPEDVRSRMRGRPAAGWGPASAAPAWRAVGPSPVRPESHAPPSWSAVSPA
jgi:hypothetical protein